MGYLVEHRFHLVFGAKNLERKNFLVDILLCPLLKPRPQLTKAPKSLTLFSKLLYWGLKLKISLSLSFYFLIRTILLFPDAWLDGKSPLEFKGEPSLISQNFIVQLLPLSHTDCWLYSIQLGRKSFLKGRSGWPISVSTTEELMEKQCSRENILNYNLNPHYPKGKH